MSCIKEGHAVGEIGNKVIRAPDWEKSVSAFEAVIDDFNIRGQRDQIEHPGWCNTFRFCPDCGTKLEESAARQPDWKTAEEVRAMTPRLKF